MSHQILSVDEFAYLLKPIGVEVYTFIFLELGISRNGELKLIKFKGNDAQLYRGAFRGFSIYT